MDPAGNVRLAAQPPIPFERYVDLLSIVGSRGVGSHGVYGSQVQQRWRIRGDAGGRKGRSDLLKTASQATLASSYGSEGWGFESLRARHSFRR